jgi:hypothetical protein
MTNHLEPRHLTEVGDVGQSILMLRFLAGQKPLIWGFRLQDNSCILTRFFGPAVEPNNNPTCRSPLTGRHARAPQFFLRGLGQLS